MELGRAILLCILGIIGITSFAVAMKILASDSNDYNRNMRKTGGLKNPLRGTIATCCEGNGRDHNISAGLAIDKRTNTWVEQGKLSDEAIDAILI